MFFCGCLWCGYKFVVEWLVEVWAVFVVYCGELFVVYAFVLGGWVGFIVVEVLLSS